MIGTKGILNATPKVISSATKKRWTPQAMLDKSNQFRKNKENWIAHNSNISSIFSKKVFLSMADYIYL